MGSVGLQVTDCRECMHELDDGETVCPACGTHVVIVPQDLNDDDWVDF